MCERGSAQWNPRDPLAPAAYVACRRLNQTGGAAGPLTALAFLGAAFFLGVAFFAAPLADFLGAAFFAALFFAPVFLAADFFFTAMFPNPLPKEKTRSIGTDLPITRRITGYYSKRSRR